jgi:hypothetical protein
MEEEKQEEVKQPKPRGGARKGAGRKAKGGEGGTHYVNFRASADVWEILQQQENKTDFIERAIKERYRRLNW